MTDTHEALNRVITVANGKGGVGKTSCTVNIAGLAAAAGWRTLVIDMDPQGNVGHDLGYRWANQGDDGAHLTSAISFGGPLSPVLTNVRPGLDVIPGGSHLDEVEDVLAGRARRGSGDPSTALRDSLAALAHDYELIIIDTPPTRPTLLQAALGASRWVVIPTRSDRASIEGLQTLATQVARVRRHHERLRVLGAVLFDSGTNATAIRRNADADITTVLGESAAPFTAVIRHAESPAVRLREEGKLAHELAAEADTAEPFWKALQDGRRPQRIPGSAGALAEDYVLLTQELLSRIAAHEAKEAQSA